ncbi:MAG: Tim44 domain-containing protein [Alphaproteobacteria bacterium]|nr:Tim44 domain-containing protein [Alphaproteobacteria bacterium]
MGSFIDIVFLMILVAFIITRLYSVFGSNGNDEKVRVIIKPIDKNAEKKLMENISKVIKESKKTDNKADIIDFDSLSEPEKSLAKIPNFNKDNFMRGACRVFEVVLQAFSSGNITGIKDLVSKKLWDAFNQVIAFRKENNMTSEVDFICFDKSEIKEVKLLKNSAKIVVEFVSEQINILRNEKGEIIEGDENFVQKITDIWTFERTLNAKNNQWTLVSTKKNA